MPKMNKSTVLVTGGSGGIGLCLAREFAKAGNDIILVSSNEERLCRAKAELYRDFEVEVSYFAEDLASARAPSSFIKELTQRAKPLISL